MAYATRNRQTTMSTAAPDNRIIALYVRVSTGYQVDKDSLPFQKKELMNYCKHILHIEDEIRIEIFEDAGKSGKNTKRPGFESMMKKIRSNMVSHVLVTKIDRISRNLVDFSIMYNDFKYNRVTFISLNEQFDTSSAIGEAVLKIILVFAELERKLTSERVMGIMLDRALEGQWNGARMPFGWHWNEEKQFPEHDEIESVFGRLMYDLYEKTHSSCKVRDYNNSHDIPTKRGGVWTSKTVADFIRNPMNRGDYRYNYRESARGRKKPDEEVIYVEGVFPSLVPVEQWDRCNAIMDENTAKKNRSGSSHQAKHVHVFSGLLECANCGAHLQVTQRDKRRANGFIPSLYCCGNKYTKRTCDSIGSSDVKLGPFIFNYISGMVRAVNMQDIHTPEELEKLLLTGPCFTNVVGIASEGLNNTFSLLSMNEKNDSYLYYPELLSASNDTNSSEIDELKQNISRIERALKRLQNAFLFDDNGINEKEYLETKMSLETKQIEAKNRMRELSEATFSTEAGEMTFIKSASSFLLTHHLQSGEYINYSEFAATIDSSVLKEFVNLVITKIIVKDGIPSSIIFKNGLEHQFLYRK